MNNYFIINDKDIGVSKIELEKDGNLIITDISNKYSLVVCIKYNKKDIENLNVDEENNILFNEYYISENNSSALLEPNISIVKRIDERRISFEFSFDINKIVYMNRKKFDIDLKSIKSKIYVDYF